MIEIKDGIINIDEILSIQKSSYLENIYNYLNIVYILRINYKSSKDDKFSYKDKVDRDNDYNKIKEILITN
jgi:hypothetical protein